MSGWCIGESLGGYETGYAFKPQQLYINQKHSNCNQSNGRNPCERKMNQEMNNSSLSTTYTFSFWKESNQSNWSNPCESKLSQSKWANQKPSDCNQSNGSNHCERKINQLNVLNVSIN